MLVLRLAWRSFLRHRRQSAVTILAVALSLALMLVFITTLAPAQETVPKGGPPPQQLRGRAVEGMVESTGDASLRQFIETHLAPKYRDSFATPDKLVEHLRAIRKACAGYGGILVDPVGDNGLLMQFMLDGGEAAVMMRIDAAPPHQIMALDLERSAPRAKGSEVAPITWVGGTLLDEEAAAGTASVAREGKSAPGRTREREWSSTTASHLRDRVGMIDDSEASSPPLSQYIGRPRTSDVARRRLRRRRRGSGPLMDRSQDRNRTYPGRVSPVFARPR
jgi:hypothetical protein